MAAAPRLTLTAPRRKGQLLTGVPTAGATFASAVAGGVSAGIGGWARDGAAVDDNSGRGRAQEWAQRRESAGPEVMRFVEDVVR